MRHGPPSKIKLILIVGHVVKATMIHHRQAHKRLTIQVILKGAEPMKYNVVERDRFRVVGVKREFSLINRENLANIPKFGYR